VVGKEESGPRAGGSGVPGPGDDPFIAFVSRLMDEEEKEKDRGEGRLEIEQTNTVGGPGLYEQEHCMDYCFFIRVPSDV